MDRKVKNMSICPIELLLKLPEIYQTMNDELTDKVDIRTGVKTNMRGSCDRMSVISLQDEIPDKFNNGSILTIKIRYVTQSYQQVGDNIINDKLYSHLIERIGIERVNITFELDYFFTFRSLLFAMLQLLVFSL